MRVHFQNLERLRRAHQRADVADRADIHLRSGQKRHGAGKIDNEPALDAAEDDAVDALGLFEGLLQFGPGLFAAGLFAAQFDDAVPVLVTLDENIDGVADIEVGFLAGGDEFLQRHTAFGFQADIDQHFFVIDLNDGALDNAAFEATFGAEGFFQEFGEIFGDRGCRLFGDGFFFRSHGFLISSSVSFSWPTGWIRWSGV